MKRSWSRIDGCVRSVFDDCQAWGLYATVDEVALDSLVGLFLDAFLALCSDGCLTVELLWPACDVPDGFAAAKHRRLW